MLLKIEYIYNLDRCYLVIMEAQDDNFKSKML